MQCRIGFEVLNLEFSPIKGPEGNIEYLLYLQKCEATDRISPADRCRRVTERNRGYAYRELDK